MTAIKKTFAAGTAALMAVGAVGGSLAAAYPADAQETTGAQAAAAQEAVSTETAMVKEVKVDGQFAFTQNEVATNAELATRIAAAAKYMCGVQDILQNEGALPEDWTVTIKGAVRNECAITLSDYRESDKAKTLVMGCTCMGNPAGGRATANAEVTGMPFNDLLEMAQPAEGANTAVFLSADGYEVALPLSYVMQRYSAIVFDVNGSPLADSMGGTNQLWLGSTPASYFARDIVSVTLENRQTPPPSPTSDEARAEIGNLPNVGVLFGGDVQ